MIRIETPTRPEVSPMFYVNTSSTKSTKSSYDGSQYRNLVEEIASESFDNDKTSLVGEELSTNNDEVIVKEDMVSNEFIVKEDIVSNEFIVKEDMVSNEVIVKEDMVSNEVIVKEGIGGNEDIVKEGMVCNDCMHPYKSLKTYNQHKSKKHQKTSVCDRRVVKLRRYDPSI